MGFFILLTVNSSIVVVVQGFLRRIVLPCVQEIIVPEQSCTTFSPPELLMARRNMNMNKRAPQKEKKPPMNDEITYDELRVTTPSAEGKDEALGIMSRAEALAKAEEMGGLDLILVNPNSDPPVC